MAYPTTLAYQILGANTVGAQGIAVTSTTQLHPLGQVVQAVDPVYGVGEFIYLKGVASTAAGDLVAYDNTAKTTVRAVDDAAKGGGSMAVAMSANVASQYGWYQIFGAAIVAYLTNASIDLSAYITATAGAISSDIVAGDILAGAQIKTAKDTPTAGFVTVQLSYPTSLSVP